MEPTAIALRITEGVLYPLGCFSSVQDNETKEEIVDENRGFEHRVRFVVSKVVGCGAFIKAVLTEIDPI